jgi:hypothetical protein
LTPYEILGVSPKASPKEISQAYKTLAQIFHPDRFVDSPAHVRREAERRMKNLTEAYALARKGVGGTAKINVQKSEAAWEAAARERVARAAKGTPWQKRERAATHGKAIARPKGRMDPSVLNGIGEARHTNKLTCRDCKSIQWLPEGWEPTLSYTNYFCSICGRLLLSR